MKIWFDTETGDVRTIKTMKNASSIPQDVEVLTNTGRCEPARKIGSEWRHVLTPLDPTSEWARKLKLMEALWASMSPEAQARATGDFRPSRGPEEVSVGKDCGDIKSWSTGSSLCYPIMGPPAAPPKTDRERVAEFVKLLSGVRVTNTQVDKLVDENREYLADTK